MDGAVPLSGGDGGAIEALKESVPFSGGDGGAIDALEEAISSNVEAEAQVSSKPNELLSPEELVAKSVAPVKKEYILPAPLSRPCSNVKASEKLCNSGLLLTEKKSKRQLKRERREKQKSVLHVCPEVARVGNIKACSYGGNCRFSHDLDAFLAQKPEDLPGTCPFMCVEEPCPYGMACRFSGTHKHGISAKKKADRNKLSEMNGLSKELQKLLWKKNKENFTRADAQLKNLGFMIKGNAKVRKTDENGAEDQEDMANRSNDQEKQDNCAIMRPSCNDISCFSSPQMEDDAIKTEDTQPLKKSKIPIDDTPCSGQMHNADHMLPETNEEQTITKSENENVLRSEDSRVLEVDADLKVNAREKKLIDFKGKLYLAPLTTAGYLPFRRVCKNLGADITCGEMAMCTNLLQGQASEWALLRRHSSEDLFGVQLCGAYPDTGARTIELVDRECTVDFIDINMGCPIDIVVNKGAGSSLLTKPMKMKNIIEAASGTVDKTITVKVRTGYLEGRNRIDSLIADIGKWGANALTIHGRSRQQRYSKLADWAYIYQCARKAQDGLQVLGNGDILSYTDWNAHLLDCPELSTAMIARGALIKVLFSSLYIEPLVFSLVFFIVIIYRKMLSFSAGVETTRHFLLEWLSYTYRYIPVGLLDIMPQRLNWRPPSFFGRDNLETLMASDSAADWIRISEMLLGPVPAGFTFTPKHKSNAYDRAENG
ncbi:tRNA-dihydrouridine(47) synthase [NAD(P)(+)]-like [Amborella trichopoda]|uniref:tRNA-dihydrouridine(47) synthase [NAD(P)(+)]-like n=1 Tax=Amborella trichopoda TaxID=13333 RepID=UPI0009BD7848|nr:tRNA-dihydrouridine(47) synthase [NAD(P)(+)]-like [Amborella trichopoda]|eukprot:XP_020528213.1 tRNA-dihydrouridine(47) synthase [NAD(P)(+)]-like [Amborella trichopoda]